MTREEFMADLSDWSNHRHFLWMALRAAKASPHPVLEMGCGDGSTPYLQKFCADAGRSLRSMDNNQEWATKFNAEYIDNRWDPDKWFTGQKYSVVLIDHAPGEKRREALELFANNPSQFEIIVLHDSEPKGWNASDYQVREIFPKFKFKYDLRSQETGGAWSSWLSNNHAILL